MCKSCSEAITAFSSSETPTGPQIATPNGTATPTGLAGPKIAGAVLTQCRKKDLTYRTAALQCVGVVTESLKVDVFRDLLEIVSPIFENVRNSQT